MPRGRRKIATAAPGRLGSGAKPVAPSFIPVELVPSASNTAVIGKLPDVRWVAELILHLGGGAGT
ncbi:MAG: hypothetical protein OK454_01360 [Thaumarchaeota archaeon]|nr:hypothetical protein [Nitrososphaerota archaeon]